MSKYQSFVFKDYTFDPSAKTLKLHYGYDDALSFTETYRFNFDFTDYNPEVLDRAIQLLFFIAGVSYYKMYLAPEISATKGSIDEAMAEFLNKTYQKGLGEFFFVNQLDPLTPIGFKPNNDNLNLLSFDQSEGFLIGLGGGKDSLVSAELLRDQPGATTWSLNHASQLAPLVSTVGLPHLSIDREWDKQIGELNQQDALNGHVPISAIFAATGVVVAVLSGKRDVVVSNESSASEPTMNYRGQNINHQYSKSLEFEKDFQSLISRSFGESIRYYSLLRPLSELRIAEVFASNWFNKYKAVFSSCNRAFTHNQNHMFWCGECAKCAFVFLIFAPFIEKAELEQLFHGKNLLLDPNLEQTYRQLLGIGGDKPFDCVGEVKEARAAMRLAQLAYPELNKYEFDIPDSYDYKQWSESSMPSEVLQLIQAKLQA